MRTRTQVAGRNPVVVLAYDTWTEQFGRRPERHRSTSVQLSGIDFTVIGIAPEGFSGTRSYIRPGFYVPLAMAPSLNTSAPSDVLERRDYRWLTGEGPVEIGRHAGAGSPGRRVDGGRRSQKQYPASNRGLGLHRSDRAAVANLSKAPTRCSSRC